MNTRITLNDRDKGALDDYETHEEVTEADELADYMNALGKLIAVSTYQDKYDVNELLRMNGVANELREGGKTVDEAKVWIEEEFEPVT